MSNTKTGVIDNTKSNAFLNKVFEDISGTYITLMCCIGDKLNLFKKLEANGPATSIELSRISGTNERYTREWLNAMACAGYLEYDPSGHTFRLTPDNASILTQEGGPMFVAGIYQQLLAETKNMEKLIEVFKKGGGISLKEFDDNEFVGMERMTAPWFENLLLQEWIPAVPDVKSKLERGALVADVGCGRGRAIIKLAQAFPKSQFVGYDIFAPVIDDAKSQAALLGILDNNRLSFQQLDVSKGFPEGQQHCYDLITTFDVIHDMANPLDALRAIYQGLKPDGTYLWLEINSRDRLEDNIGTMGALFYCWSIVYCMTTSLAEGGKGLGTVGMPQSKVTEYCREVGFSHVRKLPVDNPFNVLYEVKH
jgi:2-polyprenyl-3-methyl-5-hydroxy-6-metoxy-1,4-benzoquinol methylase